MTVLKIRLDKALTKATYNCIEFNFKMLFHGFELIPEKLLVDYFAYTFLVSKVLSFALKVFQNTLK